MADRIGQHLGNYHLVSLLGQGGYAQVYLGQHVRFNQQAAVKVLHAHLSGKEAEHFQQEAETIAALAHPSIVRVFDFDVQDGVPFLVMDYAPMAPCAGVIPREMIPPCSRATSSRRKEATLTSTATMHWIPSTSRNWRQWMQEYVRTSSIRSIKST